MDICLCLLHADHCRLDFWPDDGKAIAIAPTFEEDLTIGIADVMSEFLREAEGSREFISSSVTTLMRDTVETPKVHFRTIFSAVHTTDHGDSRLPGEMLFLCEVAQSSEEFLYHTRKVRHFIYHIYSF